MTTDKDRNICAQRQPHFRQLDDEGRAAVAEERQRDARHREEVRHHGHVGEDLEGKERRDAHDDQGAETVSGVQRQPVAPDDEQGKQQQHQARAHQAQLLTDHGEDKVVLRFGQIEEFLPPVAQAQPEHAAGANGQHGLHGLQALVLRVVPGVFPVRNA